MKKKKKKFLVKKSHKIRSLRISDEVFEGLQAIKKGTWSYTFKKLINNYKNNEHRGFIKRKT